MSDDAASPASLLSHGTPAGGGARILIEAVRRIGVGGLNDAYAASLMMGAFGLSFRRPLVLVRAMMAELARASHQSIMIAPACCCRATIAEMLLLRIVSEARDDPRRAHALIGDLCGIDRGLGILSSAQAVAQAFEDLGRPIGEVGGV